jgi:hypothetical protein
VSPLGELLDRTLTQERLIARRTNEIGIRMVVAAGVAIGIRVDPLDALRYE